MRENVPLGLRSAKKPRKSVDCARTRPPSCFTSEGSLASAWVRRFCTFTRSMSRSEPTSNDTVSEYWPSSEQSLVM